MLALVATCLVAALAAAPTAGAASSSSAAKASSAATPKAQTSQTRRTLARRISSTRRRVRRAERRISSLGRTISSEIAAVRAAFAAGDTAIDNKINGIVGAVTPILTRLGDGLTEVGGGLVALKNGVEAGFAEVKTALTDIGDFLGATEYGFAQVLVNANGQGGSFVVTPDIPDAVQQAQSTQQFIAQHSGNLVVLYGVRSAENDGTGATDPAAFCKVTVTNEGGTTETTAPNPALGGLPFQPVNDKSAQTSENPNNQGFPFGLKVNDNGADEEDKTNTFASSVAVTAGETYTVGLSCVDTSASADDPEE